MFPIPKFTDLKFTPAWIDPEFDFSPLEAITLQSDRSHGASDLEVNGSRNTHLSWSMESNCFYAIQFFFRKKQIIA